MMMATTYTIHLLLLLALILGRCARVRRDTVSGRRLRALGTCQRRQWHHSIGAAVVHSISGVGGRGGDGGESLGHLVALLQRELGGGGGDQGGLYTRDT